MNESSAGRSGFPPAYLDRVGSSFTDFLAATTPDLLPGRRPIPQLPVGDLAPHGTTIVAVTYEGGVLMGGDRRATMGNLISSRDIEKVYPADSYSVIGIAGAAGIAIEMVKLYQVELEHYEKIEGAHALPRRQGQPPRRDDPRQPRRGHAGPRRRPAVRRLRPRRRARHRPRPHLQLRRHRRELRGARLRGRRLRLAVRQELAEEDLAQRPARRRRRPHASSSPSTTPPTTTPPPAAPTRSAGSTRSSTGSTPRAPSGSPTPRWPRSPTRIVTDRAEADRQNMDAGGLTP